MILPSLFYKKGNEIMGVVEDYINSLEGQENPDLTEVAKTLLELHNKEIGITNAKIQTMQTEIQSKDAVIAEKDNKLTQQMAKNWELLNQIPADNMGGVSEIPNPDKPDPGRISFDDVLYTKNEE